MVSLFDLLAYTVFRDSQVSMRHQYLYWHSTPLSLWSARPREISYLIDQITFPNATTSLCRPTIHCPPLLGMPPMRPPDRTQMSLCFARVYPCLSHHV